MTTDPNIPNAASAAGRREGAMYSHQACCAHLRVTYVTQTTTGGQTTGWWQCGECAQRFAPAPAAAAGGNLGDDDLYGIHAAAEHDYSLANIGNAHSDRCRKAHIAGLRAVYQAAILARTTGGREGADFVAAYDAKLAELSAFIQSNQHMNQRVLAEFVVLASCLREVVSPAPDGGAPRRAGAEVWEKCPYCQHPESCRDGALACIEPAKLEELVQHGLKVAMDVYHRSKRPAAAGMGAAGAAVSTELTAPPEIWVSLVRQDEGRLGLRMWDSRGPFAVPSGGGEAIKYVRADAPAAGTADDGARLDAVRLGQMLQATPDLSCAEGADWTGIAQDLLDQHLQAYLRAAPPASPTLPAAALVERTLRTSHTDDHEQACLRQVLWYRNYLDLQEDTAAWPPGHDRFVQDVTALIAALLAARPAAAGGESGKPAPACTGCDGTGTDAWGRMCLCVS